MATIQDQTASKEAESILQTDRALIPIDDYAAREGVSRELVEQCGRLGIVQIRRHKGKAYVVDVPLGPYFYTTDSMFKTAEQSKATPDNISSKEHSSETIHTPELKAPEINNGLPDRASATDDTQLDNFGEIFGDKLLKMESEPIEFAQDSEIQPGLSDVAPFSKSFRRPDPIWLRKSNRIWQLITAILTVFLCITLFHNLLLRGDKQVQRDMLNRANEHIKRALDNSAVVSQKNEAIKAQFEQFKARADNLQKQLDESTAQVKMLQGELSRTKQYLQAIKEQNAEVIERLNKQIQILTE